MSTSIEGAAQRVKITPYIPSRHFTIVTSWWAAANEVGPTEDMLPPDSTFIAEIAGEPALCVTIYLTNTRSLAYVENFAGNPALKGGERRLAARLLSDYIANFARSLGYKNLICLAHREPLVRRYQELGFKPTITNVTAFVRSLKE